MSPVTVPVHVSVPLAPLYVPVPSVTATVTLGVPEVPPNSTEVGTERFPFIVPPVSPEMVNGAVAVAPVREAREMVLVMFPLPIPPVKLAVPAIVMLVDTVAVALIVNVVLILAAVAAAQTSSAKAKVENVRFIGLLESSTLETRNVGKFSSRSTPPIPIRRADLKSLPLARAFVHSDLLAIFGSIRRRSPEFAR
jgi:hypothetical protein